MSKALVDDVEVEVELVEVDVTSTIFYNRSFCHVICPCEDKSRSALGFNDGESKRVTPAIAW